MPKITRLGGPSVAGADDAAPARERINVTPLGRDPVNDPEYIDGAPVSEPEGDQSSPGSSSSTSPEKPKTSPEPKPAARQKRARTTGSRSTRARTGGSSARSTGGGRTGSEQN